MHNHGILSATLQDCPCCGSPRTASRSQLFRRLMNEGPLPGVFNWYSEHTPQACPPKSLFVILLLLLLGMTLPTVGLWLLGYTIALSWLARLALLLWAGLLFDVLMTYRRYKTWGGEWLCGECHSVFRLPAI